ncbi:MAG: hypothetical protein ABR599_12810 [Gemmatimonadota bacterium]
MTPRSDGAVSSRRLRVRGRGPQGLVAALSLLLAACGAAASGSGGPGGSLLPAAAGGRHPPVSGVHRAEEWITVSDFRHVTAVAAGDGEAYVGSTGGIEVLPAFATLPVTTLTAGDGLPSSVVTALAFEAGRGSLWIGTALGLARYDPFAREVVQDPVGLGTVPIRELRVSGDVALGPGASGDLFVLAADEWFRVDPFTSSARSVSAGEVPPPSGGFDWRGLPFVGGGVLRGERSGRRESFRVTAGEALFGGRAVLGTWGGNAYVFEPSRATADAVAYGLAGPGGGALGWDGERLWFTNAAASPQREARAFALPPVADEHGIASSSGRLTDWRHTYPGLEPGLPSDRVLDVAFAGGRAFFATEAGLGVLDAGTGAWSRLSGAAAGDETLAVEPAADGLWVGTRRGLLALRWIAPGGAGGPEDGSRAGGGLAVAGRWLEGREIRALAGNAAALYAATDLGLFRLAPVGPDASRWELVEVVTAGRDLRDLVLVDDELVVAGDRGVELIPLAAGEPQLFLVGESQLDEPPLAVAADRGNVWIGTRDGVARWDRIRRTWTEYGLADGLPELPVLDVLIQDARYVWFSTPGGVTRYDLGDPPRSR